MSAKSKRRARRKSKKRASAKPKRLEIREGSDTMTYEIDPDREIKTYVGEFKTGMSVEAQLRKLKESFPDIDESEINTEKATALSGTKYCGNLPEETLVRSEHPDIIVRTGTLSGITSLVQTLQEKDIQFIFAKSEVLKEQRKKFWSDPYMDMSYFEEAVMRRLGEYTNDDPDPALSPEERKLVKRLYVILKRIKEKKTGKNHQFWAFHCFEGWAAKRILEIRKKKVVEEDDSFGTSPEDVELIMNMYDLRDRDWKEMAHELKKRGVTDENGKSYKKNSLDMVEHTEALHRYGCLEHDLKEVMTNIDEDIGDVDKPTVIPKKPKIKKAMKKLGLSRLYKHQHEALKKLMDNKSVVLETASGGGKIEVPALWHMTTGKPVIMSLPNLASIYTYREFLRGFFDSDKIVVHHETFAGKKKSRRALKNFKKGKAKFLLTTPDRLLDEEAMDAVKANEGALLVFNDFHNCPSNGTAYMKDSAMEDESEIYEALENYPCLLYTNSIGVNTGDYSSEVREFEVVSGSANRPDLRLFAYRTEDMGEQLSAATKLLSELREMGFEKGILYFNSIKNRGKMKKILQKLDYPFTCYTGREKEESLWRCPGKKQLKKFSRASNMAMLAYSGFGEGLDFDDVDFVICMDMPGGSEEFYHWSNKVGTGDGNKPVFLMLGAQSIKSRKELIDSCHKESKKSQRSDYEDFLYFLKDDCNMNIGRNPVHGKSRVFSPITMEQLLEEIDPREE